MDFDTENNRTISQVTRRDILDYLVMERQSISGRLDMVTFLRRTFDLSNMRSTDSRLRDAAGDIHQHMVRNDDWPLEFLLFEYLDLLGCEDQVFLLFLEQCVHPIVLSRQDDSGSIVTAINEILQADGYVLFPTEEMSGRPIYRAIPTTSNNFIESTNNVEKNSRLTNIAGELMLVNVSHNRVFGAPRGETQFECDVFTIMPFGGDFDIIYQDHIVPSVVSHNYVIKRGDDFFSGHSIMSEIWSAIYRAKIVVADCTDRNPNVFYELGMAHVLNKKVIILTQNINDIPFDIRHLRYINYEYTPRGMKLLEQQLQAAIDAVGKD